MLKSEKMKIINRLKLTLLALLALGLSMACQVSTERTTTTNSAPAATPVNSAAQTAPTKSEMEKPAGGSLATPTDTYKTAFLAREKKDIAGLKRVFSKEILEFFAEVSKADNKNVEDALKELVEQPQAPTDASRNEKINGNKATLEYQDEKGEWKTMDFVKEGDDWKMTIPGGPPAGREEMRDMNKKGK